MKFWTLQIVLNVFFRSLKFHRKKCFFESLAEILARGHNFYILGVHTHLINFFFSQVLVGEDKNRLSHKGRF